MTEENIKTTEPAEVVTVTRNEWLGAALRYRRDRKSMTALDVGLAVGLHEQTIYAYEQGRITISWDNVVAICHAVGASSRVLASLYTRQWYGPHQSPDVQLPVS